MRFPLLACVLAATAAAAPSLHVSDAPSPAAAASFAPSFALGPDGTPWLSWVERPDGAPAPTAPGHGHGHGSAAPAVAHTLKVAAFDRSTGRWGEPRQVVTDASVTGNPFDIPLLAIDGAGALHALWTDGRGGARVSRSEDAGRTWSSPKSWTQRSKEVEKFSLTRLEDGRVLVAWLDGRAHATSPAPQQLWARLIDAPEESERQVDASVCDCCQTSLTPFLDGGALVAYRGRTPEEVRDILVARYRGGEWQRGERLHADNWKINGCPVNGPRVAGDGRRVAAAWYTAADNQPRVLASFSPDAGQRWLQPLRLDQG